MRDKVWSYGCVGGEDDWRLIDHPVEFEEGCDCDVNIKAAGYEPFDAFGVEWFSSMTSPVSFEVWSRPRCEPRDYLVVWTTPHSLCVEIIARDLPSLLKLYQLLTPLASQRVSSLLFESLNGFLEKAFHAWHGHHLDLNCRQCDREASDRAAERRRERARSKVLTQQKESEDGEEEDGR